MVNDSVVKKNVIKLAATCVRIAQNFKFYAHDSTNTVSTSRSSITKASERLSGIFELCEAILLHLPMRHLLVSIQRVSKVWRDTISGSSQLQQKLFFEQWPESKNGAYKSSEASGQ